jgi:hypothetical protein
MRTVASNGQAWEQILCLGSYLKKKSDAIHFSGSSLPFFHEQIFRKHTYILWLCGGFFTDYNTTLGCISLSSVVAIDILTLWP